MSRERLRKLSHHRLSVEYGLRIAILQLHLILVKVKFNLAKRLSLPTSRFVLNGRNQNRLDRKTGLESNIVDVTIACELCENVRVYTLNTVGANNKLNELSSKHIVHMVT